MSRVTCLNSSVLFPILPLSCCLLSRGQQGEAGGGGGHISHLAAMMGLVGDGWPGEAVIASARMLPWTPRAHWWASLLTK